MATKNQIHHRTCNLCEAMCGLVIEHDGQQVIKIKGDKNDPFSEGYICPKGALLGEIHQDPDRLKKPLKKTANGFVEIGWEEALDLAASRLKAIRKEHGKSAIAFYLGNPTVHNLGAMLYIRDLKRVLRTPNSFSATSVDQLPHHFAAYFMFGSGMLLPIPDINRTDYMIIMGANPVVSNGSIMTVAGVPNKLKAIQKRGGKVVVIDPRKTETAQLADQYHAIYPGTDVYFLLALLHLICANKDFRLGHLAPHVKGLELIPDLVKDFSPEQVAPLTGIAAEDIRQIAQEYLTQPKAVLYGRMGLSTQAHGGLCHWLINLINILSGHLDQEGGAMFPSPAVPVVNKQKGRKSFDRWRSRVSGLPEFMGELPVSLLAEEISTPGEGQIKALITHAGNPVLSTPNGQGLDQAMEQLDFMLSIDIYLNETTRHADLILPPTTGLEIEHYDIVFNALAVSNTVKYSPALFAPQEGQWHDWQIIKGLTQRLAKKKMSRFYRWGTPSRLLNLALLTGPYGRLASIRNFFTGLSLGKLKRAKHGIPLGPLKSIFPKGLRTKDDKIDLAPAIFVQELAKLRTESLNNGHVKGEHEFSLIGRRQLRSNNSWMHNSPKLMAGKNRCTLLMHPKDAERLDLLDQSTVQVKSAVGQLHISLELSEDMMPGVVSIPHGFGHNKSGTQLQVATAHAGVSINDLLDNNHIDQLTGNAAFSGQIVEVRAAEN